MRSCLRGGLLPHFKSAHSVCVGDRRKRLEIEVLVEISILKKIRIKNFYFSWRNLCFRKNRCLQNMTFQWLKYTQSTPPSGSISNNHPHIINNDNYLQSGTVKPWDHFLKTMGPLFDPHSNYFLIMLFRCARVCVCVCACV